MLFLMLSVLFACISPCLNSGAYFLVIGTDIAYTQQQAREKCHSLGAELASVHSDDDFLSIEDLMNKHGKYYDCFWIGLVLYWHVSVPMATAVPNNHIINISWVDGTLMDWGNPIESSTSSYVSDSDIWPWGHNEPSNYFNNTRNCVYVSKDKWLSGRCDTAICFPMGIVCEKKQK